MLKIAVVGCTGKLGSTIVKNILNRKNVTLSYAIALKDDNTIQGLVGVRNDKDSHAAYLH